ncbi:MAG: hypothetical protein WC565_04215 [Parcubacteria group bacterium]
MVEVAKKKDAPRQKLWNEKCEDAFQKFLAQAGWAGTPEDKQRELAGIDTKIQALEAQIERLNASKLVFDKREEMVKDLIRVAWGALEDDSTLESLLSLAKTKFKIKAKRNSAAKKKTGSSRGKVDEKLLQKLLDVLDADGKTVTQLAKEIGEGTDTKELSKLLQKLIAAERVGSEGERRSKKYFLYADGDDGDEEDEPEEDEDDEEEDELDEDEEDIEEVAGEEED